MRTWTLTGSEIGAHDPPRLYTVVSAGDALPIGETVQVHSFTPEQVEELTGARNYLASIRRTQRIAGIDEKADPHITALDNIIKQIKGTWTHEELDRVEARAKEVKAIFTELEGGDDE